MFCNPPYGREIGKWVQKAYEEAQGGTPIVLLIPARTDTSYFHDYIYGKAEIRFIRGRLRFTDDDGNAGRVTEKTKGEQSNMVDKYEKVRQEYLNICEGHNGEPCGGDPSVGIFPCPFYGYDRGCLLEGEEYKTAPFGFNRLAKEVHENAVAHGWWEEERGLPEVLMLCVSELAEALEEYRNGRPTLYYPCNAGGVCCEEDGSAHCGSRPYNPNNPEAPCSAQSKKPEGVAVELADCVIRILDYCGHAGIDLEEAIRIKHEYNKSRPYRHGGKKC